MIENTLSYYHDYILVTFSTCPKVVQLLTHNKVSHGLRIPDAHMNLPARGPASTNLPTRSPTLRTYPLVVQHMWFTSYTPPRTQHLSTLSMKHTNLPRSYPHRRVIEYEPPRSYHHMLSTIHEPTRSWDSISWSMFHQSIPTIHIDCTKLAWARSLSLSDQACLAQAKIPRLS